MTNDDTTAAAAKDSSTASAGYAAHVEGHSALDPATLAAMEKMAGLLRAKELIRTGNAAVDKTGRVVDRRAHPDAVPIAPHTVVFSDPAP